MCPCRDFRIWWRASFESRLFQYAADRSFRKIRIRVFDRHPPGLAGMLVLMMASPYGNQIPTIVLDHPDHFPTSHFLRLFPQQSLRTLSRSKWKQYTPYTLGKIIADLDEVDFSSRTGGYCAFANTSPIQSTNTRTRGDMCRLCGYSTEIGR